MKTFFLIYAVISIPVVLFVVGAFMTAERDDMEQERRERLRVTPTGPRIGRK